MAESIRRTKMSCSCLIPELMTDYWFYFFDVRHWTFWVFLSLAVKLVAMLLNPCCDCFVRLRKHHFLTHSTRLALPSLVVLFLFYCIWLRLSCVMTRLCISCTAGLLKQKIHIDNAMHSVTSRHQSAVEHCQQKLRLGLSCWSTVACSRFAHFYFIAHQPTQVILTD